MAEDPVTELGMRAYTVHKWRLREGKIAVDLFLSLSKIALN